MKLPNRRESFNTKGQIGGHKIFLSIGEYPDGRPGEIFIDISQEDSFFRTTFNMLAMAISIGLQFGVPVTKYINFMKGSITKDWFTPGEVPEYTSAFDFIAKELEVYIPMIEAVAKNYAKTIQELLPNAKVEIINKAKRNTELYAEYYIYVNDEHISQPEGFIQGLRINGS